MEKLIRIMVEEIFNAIQQDARLSISIDPGISSVGSGAGPSGPILVNSRSTLPAKGTGVIS